MTGWSARKLVPEAVKVSAAADRDRKLRRSIRLLLDATHVGLTPRRSPRSARSEAVAGAQVDGRINVIGHELNAAIAIKHVESPLVCAPEAKIVLQAATVPHGRTGRTAHHRVVQPDRS